MGLQKIFSYSLVFVIFLSSPCQARGTNLSKQIQSPVSESIRIRQATQVQEAQWRDDKQELLSSYDQLKKKKKLLIKQELVLGEQLKKTGSRIAAKQRQLDDITQIRIDIAPLIGDLNRKLEKFIANDLPFLPEERRGRLQRIAELQNDPEVSVSEIYRRVMEALLVEAEYGNTIEVYQQTISIDGHSLLVDIFRLGRVALFFQSLDQKECGFYNVAASSWKKLPVSYNRTIRTTIEIAGKRQLVELVTLPIGRMQL